MLPRGYYVYIIFRHTGCPVYVGMGKGRRYLVHNEGKSKNVRLVAIIAKAKRPPPVTIVRDELTQSEAFALEKSLIAALGRAPSGPLVNFTDGGEGTAGFKMPDEARSKMRSAATQRREDGDRERLRRQRLSEARRGVPLTDAHKAKLKIPCSDEARQKISQANAGKMWSAETRARMRAAWERRKADVAAYKAHQDRMALTSARLWSDESHREAMSTKDRARGERGRFA